MTVTQRAASTVVPARALRHIPVLLLGVRPAGGMTAVLFAVALLAGSAVAVARPVASIGLAAPQLVRPLPRK
ncbi:hypothetical protein [Streptomyces sp. NPDC057199]|uniref:hypothetical protein n=1 Tax=Streptomyces sp. NPDC057199 TaxID=3346047 RepID=UPI003638F702